MTVSEFARRWRAREIRAVDVTESCLSEIQRHDRTFNAFITVLAETARQQAETADRELDAGRDRGPLHGVPIAVKDIFDVEGVATTAASRVREGHIATANAAAISRLREAGAVIIGKTNLHEFAIGPTNEDSAFGPALNPFDTTRLSGGSSGGSAIAVATGMALAALGTDTGGSIRIPAACCGIVGLKPSLGELSTTGVVPLSRTLDHIGPMTQTVTDAWHLYHGLRGHTITRPFEIPPIARMRFAVPRRYFFDLLDEEIRSRFEHTLDALRGAGVIVEDVDIPRASLTSPVYTTLVFGEATAYHAATLESMPEKYTPGIRMRLEMARYVLAEDFVRALAGRDALTSEVDSAIAGRDALVLPSIPIPAPKLGAATMDFGGNVQPIRNTMLRLTQLFNVTGHPAISIPMGATSAGLPMGLQLVGTAKQTDTLLHVARAVESTIEPT
jgi:aspartyl-tRNA(Asn)/glutamyl-tRNA(Gln) amidotransferase subunit A